MDSTWIPREAHEQVLAPAGATRPSRDAVDVRVVRQVREGTGKIIDSQHEVGGWPALAAGPAAVDTNGDGMPDRWEQSHGFNPKYSNDGPADANGNGFPNLEEFLNETFPRG